MGKINKGFSFLLLAILVVSNLMILQASAQSIPKPTVPQFHLKVTEHSETLPPVYEIDQFTGKNVTIFEGAYYEWRTLDFTLENQFAQTPNNLYFNIRYKGEYSSNWTYLYHGDTYVRAQLGQTSIISFLISGQPVHGDLYHLPIPAGAKVDFQVEAMIGGIFRKSPEFASGYEFRGETSGWSNTQTITLSDSLYTTIPTVSPSQNITVTPYQLDSKTTVLLGFNWLQVVTLVLMGAIIFVLIVVVVFLRKRNSE